MPDTDQRIFPCSVMAGTPSGAHLAAHVLALLLVLPVYWAVQSITDSWAAVLIGVLAVVAGMLVFDASSGNYLADFRRRYSFQLGYDAPVSSLRSQAGRLLATVVVIAIALGEISILASVVLAYTVLALRLWFIARATRQTIHGTLLGYWDAAFTFLAYPDDRFDAPGGTDVVWIPDESMWHRRFVIAFQLFPFYLAIIATHSGSWSVEAPAEKYNWVHALLLLPIPWVFAICLHAPSLHRLNAELKYVLPPADTEWEQMVNRVRQATYEANGVALAHHLYIGSYLAPSEIAKHPLREPKKFDLPCRTPVLLPESALDGHAHITGPSQSGKTSVGLVSLAAQLIRGHLEPELGPGGNVRFGLDGLPICRQSDPAPMLFIDLKGELVLYNLAKEEARARGVPFHGFTLDAGKATCYFNPLASLNTTHRPVIELCEIVLSMLDLWHGFLYGKSYYSEQARNLLLKALKSASSPPQSWEELLTLLANTYDPKIHRDIFEIVGRIFALAQYPALGPAPAGVDCIHMPTIFARNSIAYFWLPALASSMSIEAVAKMALYTFLEAARAFNNSGSAHKKSYCILDEGQVICAQNFELIVQQASGGRMRIILSNQSLANLNSRDTPQLASTVWTNCRLKQSFGILDGTEREAWINLSGEEVGHLYSYTSGKNSSTTQHQVVHTRLDQNHISAVNNMPGASLFYVNSDLGFSHQKSIPRQIWTPYPMTHAEYVRRSTTPWPDAPQIQPQAAQAQTTVVNTKSAQDIEQQANDKYAELEKLFRQVSKQSARKSV